MFRPHNYQSTSLHSTTFNHSDSHIQTHQSQSTSVSPHLLQSWRQPNLPPHLPLNHPPLAQHTAHPAALNPSAPSHNHIYARSQKKSRPKHPPARLATSNSNSTPSQPTSPDHHNTNSATKALKAPAGLQAQFLLHKKTTKMQIRQQSHLRPQQKNSHPSAPPPTC